jgi:hypothetical protein
VAGERATLYSFLPNLVWLPRPLAPLTDIENSFAQTLLKRLSRSIFESVPLSGTLSAYAEAAWSLLPRPTDSVPDQFLSTDGLPTFTAPSRYLSRRLAYNMRVAEGVVALLEGRPLRRKVICSRYTMGLPDLGPEVLLELANDLQSYDAAVASALDGVPRDIRARRDLPTEV